MANATTIDQALGELLRLADDAADNVSKNVISAYRKDVAHKSNVASISSSKFRLAELETCAKFMKIPLTNEGCSKKLYSNKADLADRLIVKIESLFPQKCQECESDYCSSLHTEETLFECFLCTQLSHNCDQIKAKHAQLADIDLPVGMIWLCEGCHRKNNYYGKKVIINLNRDPKEAEEQPANTTGHNPEGLIDLTRSTEICQNYRHGKCQHGINGNKIVDGEKCKHLHPKRCFKYCRFGSSHRLGCAFGNSCRWFHPILCRFSARYGLCEKTDCTYVHLANTARSRTSFQKRSKSSHPYSHSKKNWQGRPPKRGGIPHRPRDSQDNQQNNGFHEYNDYEEFPAPFWKKHNSDGSPQPPSTSNFLGLSKQIQEMAFTLKNIQEEWKGMKGLSAKPTTPPYPPNPSQWSPADIQNQTMYKTVPESSQIWY